MIPAAVITFHGSNRQFYRIQYLKVTVNRLLMNIHDFLIMIFVKL